MGTEKQDTDATAFLAEHNKKLEMLGAFVLDFALAEGLLFITLQTLSRVDVRVAQAIFSGSMRADGAMKLIKRLLEARGEDETKIARYVEIFRHLADINAARNLILHYGLTAGRGEKDFFATNSLIALSKSREKTLPFTTEILNQLARDIAKVQTHLVVELKDYEDVTAEAKAITQEFYGPTLRQPWLYKPPQPSSGNPPDLPTTPTQ
jgi:hypothetical protein